MAETVKPRLYDTTCCQTGCETGLTTGGATGCIVFTNIQPVVKLVVQPAVQLCIRSDNRLHRVNGVLELILTLSVNLCLSRHHYIANVKANSHQCYT